MFCVKELPTVWMSLNTFSSFPLQIAVTKRKAVQLTSGCPPTSWFHPVLVHVNWAGLGPLLLNLNGRDYKVVGGPWQQTYNRSDSVRQSDDMSKQGEHSLCSAHCNRYFTFMFIVFRLCYIVLCYTVLQLSEQYNIIVSLLCLSCQHVSLLVHEDSYFQVMIR